MKLRNLTPHAILVCGLEVPSEPVSARVEMSRVVIGTILVGEMEVPLYRPQMGEVTGLPSPESGVLLIVSRVVAAAVPGRDDVVFPDDLVRDEAGRVVGANGLSKA